MEPQLSKVSSDKLMEMLNVSKGSIYKMINAKLLKPFYIPGFRKPYFDLEEVEKVFKRKV